MTNESHDDSEKTQRRLEVALLLLLSRLSLSDEQARWARKVLAEKIDMARFIDICSQSFAAPFVVRHSQHIGLDEIEKNAGQRLADTALSFAKHNLFLASEQASFHRKCVMPITERYVYLKGPATAAAYYGNIGVRVSRDIDILVHKDDHEALLRHAWSAGFTPLLEPESGIEVAGERDFRALLDYSINHIALKSPGGMMVEIHIAVDSKDSIAPDTFLSNRQTVNLGSSEFAIPATSCLFNYLCVHHTRHYFSRANWVADLITISADRGFDRNEALQFAEAHGLGQLVACCLEFADCCGQPWRWVDDAPLGDAGDLLQYCIDVFGRPPSEERRLSRARHRKQAHFSWERPDNWPAAIVRRLLGRPFSRREERYMLLRFYIRRPLPRVLQFLYVLPRLFDGAINRSRD
ncbi:MAG: nucleotidyltransferase family protein [Pseudomonadota bacterium]